MKERERWNFFFLNMNLGIESSQFHLVFVFITLFLLNIKINVGYLMTKDLPMWDGVLKSGNASHTILFYFIFTLCQIFLISGKNLTS